MCVGDACCLAGGGVLPSLQILPLCSDHLLIPHIGVLVSVLTSLGLELSQPGKNCVWLLLFSATPWGQVTILAGIAGILAGIPPGCFHHGSGSYCHGSLNAGLNVLNVAN